MLIEQSSMRRRRRSRSEPLRFGLHLVKNSEKFSLRCNNFQASIFNERQRLAVPLAAKRLGELICMPILPMSKPLSITAAMLQ
jgi:hypothetical protein